MLTKDDKYVITSFTWKQHFMYRVKNIVSFLLILVRNVVKTFYPFHKVSISEKAINKLDKKSNYSYLKERII